MLKKLLIKLIVLLFALYILLKILQPYLPNWVSIILNSDPRYLKDSIEVAKDTYRWDKNDR